MFCGNCGKANEAGTVFCENCGARLETEEQEVYEQQQPTQSQYQQPQYQVPQYQQPQFYQPEPPAKKKSKLPLIIGIIVLAIAIAVGCYFLLGGNDSGKENDSDVGSNVRNVDVNSSAEAAALAFAEGVTTNDPDKAVSSLYLEMEGVEKEIRDECASLKEQMEQNNIVCSGHRVIETEDCSDEISDAENYLEDPYNTYAEIEELTLVTVRIDRTVGNESDTQDIDIYVAKIDGKWYVIRTD